MSERMRRVNEALREVLSEGIGELKDPRIGFVTVTGVRASPDLRQATVFVSVLGSEKKRDATLAGLESSTCAPAGAREPGAPSEANSAIEV